MILYQILNTETGKKLYSRSYGDCIGVWSNKGNFWRTPDAINEHLEWLLYEWNASVKSIYYTEYKKGSEFNHELAKRLKVIATEMQTIGASKVYDVGHFMEKSDRVSEI